MQGPMIENDKKLDKVKAWTNQVESDLERYDQLLGKSQHCLKELRVANQTEKMRKQESMEEYKKQKRYQEELEIEEMKLKKKREYEREEK